MQIFASTTRQQLPLPGLTVLALPKPDDTIRHWIAVACIRAREAKNPKRQQSHVAASLDANQSTITRFENEIGWPDDLDLVVAAYADDLDMQPIELWGEALRLWRTEGRQPDLNELKARIRDEKEAKRLKRARRLAAVPPPPAPEALPPAQTPQPDEEAEQLDQTGGD